MTADTDSEASTPPQPRVPRHAAGEPELPPPGRRFGLTGGHWLAVARFLVAVGVSAVLCLLLDRFAAPSLKGPTDVVGYPTFTNFNSKPSVLVLPADCVCVPFVRDRRVRATGTVWAAADPRSATRQADHRAGRAGPHGTTHGRAGVVGHPGAGLAASGGGRHRMRFPYRTPGSDRRRRGCGLRGADHCRRRGVGAPH